MKIKNTSIKVIFLQFLTTRITTAYNWFLTLQKILMDISSTLKIRKNRIFLYGLRHGQHK